MTSKTLIAFGLFASFISFGCSKKQISIPAGNWAATSESGKPLGNLVFEGDNIMKIPGSTPPIEGIYTIDTSKDPNVLIFHSFIDKSVKYSPVKFDKDGTIKMTRLYDEMPTGWRDSSFIITIQK